MSVSYDRFVRNLGESTLIAEFSPGTAEKGSVTLTVDQAYPASNQVQPTGRGRSAGTGGAR